MEMMGKGLTFHGLVNNFIVDLGFVRLFLVPSSTLSQIIALNIFFSQEFSEQFRSLGLVPITIFATNDGSTRR